MSRLLPSVAISIVLILLAAGCGDDGEAPDGLVSASLTITFSRQVSGEEIEYRVSCEGGSGTVVGEPEGVSADGACNVLAETQNQRYLIEGPPADEVCSLGSDGDHRAHVVGTIDGESVDIVIDRLDGCAMGRWDALVGLLPPGPTG